MTNIIAFGKAAGVTEIHAELLAISLHKNKKKKKRKKERGQNRKKRKEKTMKSHWVWLAKSHSGFVLPLCLSIDTVDSILGFPTKPLLAKQIYNAS